MVDQNRTLSRVDFSDSELLSSPRAPASSSPTPTSSHHHSPSTRHRISTDPQIRTDLRKKNVASLIRRTSKGLKVSNSLNNGSLRSPTRNGHTPTRIRVPSGSSDDRMLHINTSSRDSNPEPHLYRSYFRIRISKLVILNQTWLKPIEPLSNCWLEVKRDLEVSLVSENDKQIDSFHFNLRSDLHEAYFKTEPAKPGCYNQFVLLFKTKRQLMRKELNLINPNILPMTTLPRFDKVWFHTVGTETETMKFHDLITGLKLKLFHQSLEELNDLFLRAQPTSPALFYGKGVNSSLIRARQERLHRTGLNDEGDLITRETVAEPPRTRSSNSTLYSLETASAGLSREVIDDQHENVPLTNQIKFKPNLDFKFKDKRTFTITNSDFKCLYNNNWINDNLIDFFLKLNVEKVCERNKSLNDEILLLNSFFFTKLISTDDYYENVKNWFKDDKLFSYKYVIVPVNQDLHWYCLIIHNLSSQYLQLQESNKNDVQDVSVVNDNIEIFILDSLKQSHRSLKGPLVGFLTDFARIRYNMSLKTENFKIYISPIPKQTNFNDCGIHVIYNIEIFLNHIEQFKEIWKKNRKQYKNQNQLFNISDRQNLRRSLREVLVSLLREQERSKGNDFEQIGEIKNEELKDDDEDQKMGGIEDDDSDFEIIESNEIARDVTVEGEDVGTQDSENVNADNESEDLTADHGLSDPGLSLSFNDFYSFVSNASKNDEMVTPKSFQKAIESDYGLQSFNAVLIFLLFFEKDVLRDPRYVLDLTELAKYFNILTKNDVIDKDILRQYFENFIALKEDEKDNAPFSSDVMQLSSDIGGIGSELNAKQKETSSNEVSSNDNLSVDVSSEKPEARSKIVSISDDEYDYMKSSLDKNRERFMSSFPESEDSVEILNERRSGTRNDFGNELKSDSRSNSASPQFARSILDALPIISSHSLRSSTKLDNESMGNRKKFKRS